MAIKIKCAYCGNSFTRAGVLRKHIYTVHEGHKDYKCESCGKSFSLQGTLKNHIHTAHERKRDGKIYKCDICDFSCNKRGNLKQHIKKAHSLYKKEKKQDPKDLFNFKCNLCETTFEVDKNKSQNSGAHLIRIHFKRVHEIERKYICVITDNISL